jgi:hypothetical protein
MSDTFALLVGNMMQLRHMQEWCVLLDAYLQPKETIDWLYKNKAVVFLSLIQFNYVGLLLRVIDKFVQHRFTTLAKFMTWTRTSPLMHKVCCMLCKVPRLREEPWTRGALMQNPDALHALLSVNPNPKFVGYAKELVKRDARHAVLFDVVPRATLRTCPMYQVLLTTEQFHDGLKAFAAFQLTLPGIVNAVNGNRGYRGGKFWAEDDNRTPSAQPWVRTMVAFLGDFKFAAPTETAVLARPTLHPPHGMLRYRVSKKKFALPETKSRKKARV